jgi:hypothetical protein
MIFDHKVREGVVTKNNGSGANEANWGRCVPIRFIISLV